MDVLPDIAVNTVGVSYVFSSGTGTLTLIGDAVGIQTASGTCASNCTVTDSNPIGTSPFNYNFAITATINGNGNVIAGTNNLNVTGTVAALSDANPLLLGTVQQFGVSSGGAYEFVVQDTSGSLATSGFYGAPGSLVGIIVHDTSLPTTFTSGFTVVQSGGSSNSGYNGTADIGVPTPEPASLLLLLSGSGVLGLLRKRFRRA